MGGTIPARNQRPPCGDDRSRMPLGVDDNSQATIGFGNDPGNDQMPSATFFLYHFDPHCGPTSLGTSMVPSRLPSLRFFLMAQSTLSLTKALVGSHYLAPSIRSRLKAALIKARWVNACGKLPRASPLLPVCSAYRPRWLA